MESSKAWTVIAYLSLALGAVSVLLITFLYSLSDQLFYDGAHQIAIDVILDLPEVLIALGVIIGLWLGIILKHFEDKINAKFTQYNFMVKKQGRYLTRKRKSPGYTTKVMPADEVDSKGFVKIE